MSNGLPLAPPITLTAVGTGREVCLRSPGLPSLLLVLAQETQADADTVEAAVRAEWPDAAQVLVAHVADLRKIPGMFRKVAEGVMSSEFQKASRALEPGQHPFDYCVILADWTGDVAKALDLPEPSKTMTGIVLTADGRIAGTFAGAGNKEALDLLRKAIANP
jgi:hypothetical protein